MAGNYPKPNAKASGFREAMAWFRPKMQDLTALIWPSNCLQCEAQLDCDAGLCAACWSEVAWCHGACCFGCGAPVPAGPPGEAVEHMICAHCAETPPRWDHARAVFRYEGVGRNLVLRLKSKGRADIVAMAGRWMARSATGMTTSDSLIVPVPIHPRRLRERGFNQAALLARAMLRHGLPGQYEPMVLARREMGPKMAHIPNAEARFAALKNGFEVSAAFRDRLADQPVLLVDDVLTSGATLDACTRALRSAGAARVEAVVLARHCRRFERRPMTLD